MITAGLEKILRRRSIQSDGLYTNQSLRTKQGRKQWELRHYDQLEKNLLNWQNAIIALTQSEIFNEGLYYFFTRNQPKYFLAPIKAIMNYIDQEYGNYLRLDISAIDRRRIKDLISETHTGIKIGSNRIFPTIHYPFLDRQYFNHANWNKQPENVVVMEVLATKNQISIIDQNSNTSQKCSCTEKESCGCNKEKSCSERISSDLTNLQKTKMGNLQDYLSEFRSKPIIHVGYADLLGHSGSILYVRCYCQIQGNGGDTLGAPHCKAGARGQWCTYNYDCNSGSENCRTAESQIPHY